MQFTYEMPKISDKRRRVDATIDRAAYEWLASKIEDHTFANFSHGLEFCIFKVMESEKRERPRAHFRFEHSKNLSSPAPLLFSASPLGMRPIILLAGAVTPSAS